MLEGTRTNGHSTDAMRSLLMEVARSLLNRDAEPEGNLVRFRICPDAVSMLKHGCVLAKVVTH